MRRRAVLGVSLVIFLSLFFYTILSEHGLLHLFSIKHEVRTYKVKIVHLADENRQLKLELNRLRHDNEYLEKIIRSKLGMVKDGEIIFRFSD